MVNKKYLLLLFERPLEPVFTPKGPNKTVFVLPPEYLSEYGPNGQEITRKFIEEAGETVTVKYVTPPLLDDILTLKKRAGFSRFIPKHRRIAGKLIEILIGAKDIDELLSLAIYTRDRVNPYLFSFSFSIAILHRRDTQDLDVPSIIHYFPDKFFDSNIFPKAREIAATIPEALREPIEVPLQFTSSDLDEESRLAYWREEIGINLHHWHWHVVYPFEASKSVVNKDRRGELFFYSHQQIMARYNFERLSNNLALVREFTNWDAPIPEAYFPKLISSGSGLAWPSRSANIQFRNIKIDSEELDISFDEMKIWRSRIVQAIKDGYVTDENGKKIVLDEEKGIDIISNVLESSLLSPNLAFYGDLHNMGHVVAAYLHDPEHKYLESFGVMADSSTALRDPFLFPWHMFVNNTLESFRYTLPSYTSEQLDYPGISVSSLNIQSEGEGDNLLKTFWQKSIVDISKGLDFSPRGTVNVKFTHLQHKSFKYIIDVINNSSEIKQGTCRIFIGPKFDEKGKPWPFKIQKGLFIELDKFKVNLKPGKQTIIQASESSSVTIPFSQVYRDIDWTRPENGENFNLCGCGWPHYMLLPKGTPEGLQCQLFVMISDYDKDKVEQDIRGYCNDGFSYCGIKDKKYPDRRAMGYPFDRLPRSGVEKVQEFLTPNMKVEDVTIKFEDTVVGN